MESVVFFNTGWMTHYAGESDTDPIQGGGKHVDIYHSGGEMFNFKAHRKKLYGYVQTVRGSELRLERINASAQDNKLEGITVVWTARHPTEGGTRVIGWYTDATLYRYYQEIDFSRASSWNWEGREAGYFAVGSGGNAELLPRDARNLHVLRGKGGMGQSNVWYAEHSPAFVQEVLDYIASYPVIPPPKIPPGTGKPSRQPDVLRRLAVEKKAVEMTIAYYEKLGYSLHSVEKDNVGWDLEATCEMSTLKLEVKGLSGPDLIVELTPNEYKNLQAHRPSYRVCVVTQALTAPVLEVFAYIKEKACWISETGKVLAFDEILSACGRAN